MAPKQPEEKPHMPSSSEEEEEEEESGSSEEESGSSEEESESSHEDSKKDDDQVHQATQILEDESESDSDTQKTTKSTQILVAESEDESDSDSDTQKTTKSTLPEKRSLKQTEEPEGNKKMKKTSDEVEKKKITGDEAKQMFQRLFSEADEIALLQGILDFTSTGGDPSKDMDAFVDYVKNSISFKANKSQFKTKIQRLKKKFANTVRNSLKKGLSQDQIVLSRDVDQRVFDLSRKIWGDNGVSVSKSRSKKVEESPKSFRLVAHKKIQETVKPEGNGVVDSTSLELSDFFKTENVYAFGLDETALIGGWDMVKDGSKKRAVEEKLRKLRAMQVELCLKRTGLVAESAKLIFKD